VSVTTASIQSAPFKVQNMALRMNFPVYKKVNISDLIPYARNARTHTDAQVAQIAASIREFGFTNPVLVDEDYGIIAGHGRLLAAQKLGMTELPAMVIAGLSAAQKRALVLATTASRSTPDGTRTCCGWNSPTWPRTGSTFCSPASVRTRSLASSPTPVRA
jgi:hypothetical protein